MKNLGVVANLQRAGTEEIIRRIIDWCEQNDVSLFLCNELTDLNRRSGSVVSEADLPSKSDVIISIGGDGTLLATARLIGKSCVPILGINAGSLGFLTVQRPDDLEDALERIRRSEYDIENRMMLEARVLGDDQHDSIFALNDVVVGRSDVRMIKLALYSDDIYTCSYAADGLIIATPTGSTAYSLAVGGPILNPRMDAMIASPIAPHSLASRPLIFSSDEKLTLEIASDTDLAMMTVDGQVSISLKRGDRIGVKKADRHVSLIRFEENSFYGILQSKLHWGVLPVGESPQDESPD